MVSWIDCFEPEAKLKITATGLNGSRKKKKKKSTITAARKQNVLCSMASSFHSTNTFGLLAVLPTFRVVDSGNDLKDTSFPRFLSTLKATSKIGHHRGEDGGSHLQSQHFGVGGERNGSSKLV